VRQHQFGHQKTRRGGRAETHSLTLFDLYQNAVHRTSKIYRQQIYRDGNFHRPVVARAGRRAIQNSPAQIGLLAAPAMTRHVGVANAADHAGAILSPKVSRTTSVRRQKPVSPRTAPGWYE
jgi:hypothetical protein